MKNSNAKFLHTLSAGIAFGSLAMACGADAPPAPVTTGTEVNNGQPTATTMGTPPPNVGPAVPPAGPAVPSGPPVAQQPTVNTAPTAAPATSPTAAGTAPPAVAPTGTMMDLPIPGQVTPGTTPGATSAPVVVSPPPATSAPAAVDPPEPEEEDPPPAMGGEGNALTASDAKWISLASNGVGVVGSWYEFHDKVSTDIEIAAVDGVVCLTGTVAAKADAEDYDTYGAGMGLNLNDEAIWDGSAYSGFSFTAEFTSDNPIEVRLPMKALQDTGKEHFVALKTGSNHVAWSDVEQPTWVADEGSDVDFDPAKIVALQFAVTATVDGDNTFELCISDLVVDE